MTIVRKEGLACECHPGSISLSCEDFPAHTGVAPGCCALSHIFTVGGLGGSGLWPWYLKIEASWNTKGRKLRGTTPTMVLTHIRNVVLESSWKMLEVLLVSFCHYICPTDTTNQRNKKSVSSQLFYPCLFHVLFQDFSSPGVHFFAWHLQDVWCSWAQRCGQLGDLPAGNPRGLPGQAAWRKEFHASRMHRNIMGYDGMCRCFFWIYIHTFTIIYIYTIVGHETSTSTS